MGRWPFAPGGPAGVRLTEQGFPRMQKSARGAHFGSNLLLALDSMWRVLATSDVGIATLSLLFLKF